MAPSSGKAIAVGITNSKVRLFSQQGAWKGAIHTGSHLQIFLAAFLASENEIIFTIV